MSFFRPQSARHLSKFINEIIETWENLTPEQQATGEWVNPDEPIVLSVPNPEFEGNKYDDEDDYGHPRRLCFHVISHGGGGDIDEDGDECGHQGVEIDGMEIGPGFLLNGRRISRG